jgi:hypothetical protein
VTQIHTEGPHPVEPYVNPNTGRVVRAGLSAVTYEYRVEEDDAVNEALRERQTAALANLLRWIAEHRAESETPGMP